MDLLSLTAIACNPDAPVRKRVEALAEVVEGVSLQDTTIPSQIVEALDDPAVIEAAIAMRRTSTVCAALHQLGTGPDQMSTRRRVVRRLVAAGAPGIELAGLAFSIGDVIPGVAIAIRDFDEAIVPRLRGGYDPVTTAWLHWLADQPDVAAAGILRRLSTSGVDLARLLEQATNAARHARLRAIARSIVPS